MSYWSIGRAEEDANEVLAWGPMGDVYAEEARLPLEEAAGKTFQMSTLRSMHSTVVQAA